MVRHDQWHAVVAMRLPSQLADRELRLEKSLGREGAQRQYDLRSDELDLTNQVRRARNDLVGQRIAVTRRTMLEDIRNEHVLTPEVDRSEDLVQQLARLADERLALLILVRAGRFADAHEVGVGVSDTWDGIRRARVQLAAPAPCDDLRDLLERVELGGRVVEQGAARTTDDESGGDVRERRRSCLPGLRR